MHIMYIYNLLETDFANNLIMSDCSKISILGRSIKHVTLVDYANSEGTCIAVRSNGLQPQVVLYLVPVPAVITGMYFTYFVSLS